MKRTIGSFDEVTLAAIEAVREICRSVVTKSTTLNAIHSMAVDGDTACRYFEVGGEFYYQGQGIYFTVSFTLKHSFSGWEIGDYETRFRSGNQIDGDGIDLQVKRRSLVPRSSIDVQRIKGFRKWLKS